MDRIGAERAALHQLENVTSSIHLYGGDIKKVLEFASIVEERLNKSTTKNGDEIRGLALVSRPYLLAFAKITLNKNF